MSFLPESLGMKIIVSGILLTLVSTIVSTFDVVNTYGKAATLSQCPTTSDCGLRANLVVSYIGIGLLCIGLTLVAIGIVLVLKSKLKQHK